MTDSGLAAQPDTFCVLVDSLPFACSIDEFETGLEVGVRAGRTYLNTLIKNGEADESKSYAGLIYDPTGLTMDIIAGINLNGSATSRLVNAAGKVDWMQMHPFVDFDHAIYQQPWLIGRGQFLWGHAVTHRGFPGAGSGLTADQDRYAMIAVIDGLADTLQPHMTEYLLSQRASGHSWLGGKPQEAYAAAANLCDTRIAHAVS